MIKEGRGYLELGAGLRRSGDTVRRGRRTSGIGGGGQGYLRFRGPCCLVRRLLARRPGGSFRGFCSGVVCRIHAAVTYQPNPLYLSEKE